MFSFLFWPKQSRWIIFADIMRQIFVVVFALTQFFIPALPSMGIGQPIGAQVGGNSAMSPEVPAGYAFGIWFVIFALALLYAVYQALPSQRENWVLRATGWWVAGAFFLSSLWMLVTQMIGDVWPLVLIIAGMLVCSLAAFFVSLRAGQSAWFYCWIQLPLLGLQSGWLSLATCLNISSVFKKFVVVPSGAMTNIFASAVLSVATILALVIIRASKGSVWYAGAVVWGLLGVVVANVVRPGALPVAGVAVVLVTAVFFFALRVRR